MKNNILKSYWLSFSSFFVAIVLLCFFFSNNEYLPAIIAILLLILPFILKKIGTNKVLKTFIVFLLSIGVFYCFVPFKIGFSTSAEIKKTFTLIPIIYADLSVEGFNNIKIIENREYLVGTNGQKYLLGGGGVLEVSSPRYMLMIKI